MEIGTFTYEHAGVRTMIQRGEGWTSVRTKRSKLTTRFGTYRPISPLGISQSHMLHSCPIYATPFSPELQTGRRQGRSRYDGRSNSKLNMQGAPSSHTGAGCYTNVLHRPTRPAGTTDTVPGPGLSGWPVSYVGLAPVCILDAPDILDRNDPFNMLTRGNILHMGSTAR